MKQLNARPSSIEFLSRYLHEPVNCLTHLLGAVFSALGMAILLTRSWGRPLYVASFAVYGVSSVLLYLASSLFHGLKVSPEARRMLLRLDHVGIFALIAGSYTPVALIVLREHSALLGWGLFWLVWGLALLGMVFKILWLDAPYWLSTSFYLLLGWLALFVIVPIKEALPAGGFFLLFLGGILYSVGAVVFALERPDPYPGVFGHHELWHLFVLAGGSSYFMMLFLYVAAL